MATIVTITGYELYAYLIIALISLYYLCTYNIPFNKEQLLEYFIYLVHKINLLILFVTFGLATILVGVGYTLANINNFIEGGVYAILFFSVLDYSIFYLIKFVIYCKEFADKNDLYVVDIYKEVKTSDNKKTGERK